MGSHFGSSGPQKNREVKLHATHKIYQNG